MLILVSQSITLQNQFYRKSGTIFDGKLISNAFEGMFAF